MRYASSNLLATLNFEQVGWTCPSTARTNIGVASATSLLDRPLEATVATRSRVHDWSMPAAELLGFVHRPQFAADAYANLADLIVDLARKRLPVRSVDRALAETMASDAQYRP